MKVVLDANVVIASFVCPGICRSVYENCINNHEIFLSEPLIREIQKGFIKKIKMTQDKALQNLEFLKASSQMMIPLEIPAGSSRDPKDLHVLGLAMAAKVEFIVSGDEDLLILKKFQNIPILSPRGFWEIMRGKKGAR